MVKKLARKSSKAAKSKPKAASRKKPAPPRAPARKSRRRFIIQLSGCSQGYDKPEGDRSSLNTFVFTVEARRVTEIEEPLLAAIEDARQDGGLLCDVRKLYIDWILDPERGTGLQWESSTITGMLGGPSRLHQAHGIYTWSRDKDSEDSLFLDDEVDVVVTVVAITEPEHPQVIEAEAEEVHTPQCREDELLAEHNELCTREPDHHQIEYCQCSVAHEYMALKQPQEPVASSG